MELCVPTSLKNVGQVRGSESSVWQCGSQISYLSVLVPQHPSLLGSSGALMRRERRWLFFQNPLKQLMQVESGDLTIWYLYFKKNQTLEYICTTSEMVCEGSLRGF